MLQFIKRHPLPVVLSVVVVLPVVLITTWTLISLNYSYSTGMRAGYVQKISKRGWLCKTWEGELQLTAIPGSAPQLFEFSIRSDSLAAKVNEFAGKQVALEYKQHKGVPTSCFGETEYYVTGVRAVAP